MSETKPLSCKLHYLGGGSDKVYDVYLAPERVKGFISGWTVEFRYGRRGGSMNMGSKCHNVGYSVALDIYHNLVNEKRAKGYKVIERDYEPIGVITTENHESEPLPNNDYLPQLLNAIDENEAAKLLIDSAWVAQEKFDGRRIMIRRFVSTAQAYNRRGKPVEMSKPVMAAIRALPAPFLVDGECIGDKYYAFDMLERNESFRMKPYRERYTGLCNLLSGEPADGPLQLSGLAVTAAGKGRLMRKLKADNKEGIVFKRYLANHTPGRPASGGDQLKCKFWSSCSAVVARTNDKRSVSLQLFDVIDGQVEVGSCTIPPNKDVPLAGSVVEIRYLYAYKGGSLYQPIYIGLRDDVDPGDCTTDQLKYKSENEEE